MDRHECQMVERWTPLGSPPINSPILAQDECWRRFWLKTAAGEQDESFGCRTHGELAGRCVCSCVRTSLAKIGNTDHKKWFVAESASHKRTGRFRQWGRGDWVSPRQIPPALKCYHLQNWKESEECLWGYKKNEALQGSLQSRRARFVLRDW